jgi:DNA-binding response OmpR family regulator
MKPKTTFLLVEDDPNDRELVEREFAHDHFVFHSVRDGAEAVEYLEGVGKFADRKEFPLPSVILLDLKMPRMNGFDFLEWMKHAPDNLCATPVVVMSSSDSAEDVSRAYRLGANAYMVKPIRFDHFIERMKLVGLFWSEMEKPVREKDPVA